MGKNIFQIGSVLSESAANGLQYNPSGQLCDVNVRPLKVLVFAADRLGLLLQVLGIIMDRTPEKFNVFLYLSLDPGCLLSCLTKRRSKRNHVRGDLLLECNG